MSILGQKGLSGIVKIFLDLVFWGGSLIFITLPLALNFYMTNIFPENEPYYFLLAFLYVTGFFALCILFELRKIFKTINNMTPFKMSNVKSLRNMALSSFIISGCYVVKILLYNSFLTIVMSMVFIIAGLFSLILSEVFRQAVIAKEENDLTI